MRNDEICPAVPGDKVVRVDKVRIVPGRDLRDTAQIVEPIPLIRLMTICRNTRAQTRGAQPGSPVLLSQGCCADISLTAPLQLLPDPIFFQQLFAPDLLAPRLLKYFR